MYSESQGVSRYRKTLQQVLFLASDQCSIFTFVSRLFIALGGCVFPKAAALEKKSRPYYSGCQRVTASIAIPPRTSTSFLFLSFARCLHFVRCFFSLWSQRLCAVSRPKSHSWQLTSLKIGAATVSVTLNSGSFSPVSINARKPKLRLC